MRKRIDEWLMTFTLFFLPATISISSVSGVVELHHSLDDELAELFFLIAAVLGLIFLAAVLVNISILLIMMVGDAIQVEKRERYYKKHPEEAKKRREKTAKDFEMLAKALKEERGESDNGID